MALAERVVEIELSAQQAAVMEATDRFVDLEGAVRSGKTRLGAEKLANIVIEHPGIHCLATRYKEKDVDSKVVPVWRAVAKEHGLTLRWNAKEQCDEVLDPITKTYRSRVYLLGLRSSDNQSTAGKVRGLTLGFIWADQAEEIPLVVFNELKLRLSQKGFPNQLIITPNPPGPEHWINEEFPEDNSRPMHRYIRTSIYDNAHNLADGTVEANEDSFPPGTAFHDALLLGKRGFSVKGLPVYEGYYFPEKHEVPIEYDPRYDLLESWDFGWTHPAVVWGQMPPGEFRILGGVMATNMGLVEFVPLVLSTRNRWFGELRKPPSVTCDGSGTNRSKDGLEGTSVSTLQSFDINPTPNRRANTEYGRRKVIESMWAWMRRVNHTGDMAFKVNPRFLYVLKSRRPTDDVPVIARGFTTGYVWPEPRTDHNLTKVPLMLPKKDGFFDHTQNCVEYMLAQFGDVPGSEEDIRKETVRHEREANAARKDYDPDDRRRPVGGMSRGGW